MRKERYEFEPYEKEMQATIVESIQEDGKFYLVLNQTIFYPEGGGQLSDIGWIENIPVIHVQKREGKIYHEVEKEIAKGTNVLCKLNFPYRFANMQKHTAEHLISGLIHEKYQAENVGFHMNPDFVTMDFNVFLTKEQVEEIERLANQAIYQNISIEIFYDKKENLTSIPYRSKKDLDGEIRLVKIPGYDLCACCGIHVARTGEIGILKLTSIEKYKSGCRITMLCGETAFQNYSRQYSTVNQISTLLSVPMENVLSAVTNLKNELSNAKLAYHKLRLEKIEQDLKSFSEEETILFWKEDLSFEEMKYFAKQGKEKCKNYIAVFSQKEDGMDYVIASNHIDVRELAQTLNQAFKGKGGGSSQMVQGKLHASKQDILSRLS